MPAKRARGKTTIPKPTRGSSLNPSHVPADSQMHLSDEQPHEPMPNAFNPHEGLNSYPSSAQASYAPFAPAHDVIDTYAGPSNAYAGPSSAQAGYAPFAPAHDIIDTYAGPSNTYAGHALPSLRYLRRQREKVQARAYCTKRGKARACLQKQVKGGKVQCEVRKGKSFLIVERYANKEMEIYALGSLVDSGWMLLDGWRYRALKRGKARAHIPPQAGYAPFTPAHDVIDTYAGPSNAYTGPSSAQADYAPFAPAHDVIDTYAGPSNAYEDYDSYSSRHLNDLSHFNSMQAPNLHHIQLPQSFDDEDEPTDPQHRPLPITTGEISQSHVIHTAGPARSSNTRRRTRKLPATPYVAHETVVSETTQAAAGLAEAPDSNRRLQITGPMREQIFKRSKELVIGISVIRKAMPKIPGLRGTPRWDNQKKDLAKIWRAVLIMRTELTTLTQEGIVLAYELFPPQGSSISPEAFRIERIYAQIFVQCGWDANDPFKIQESVHPTPHHEIGSLSESSGCTLLWVLTADGDGGMGEVDGDSVVSGDKRSADVQHGARHLCLSWVGSEAKKASDLRKILICETEIWFSDSRAWAGPGLFGPGLGQPRASSRAMHITRWGQPAHSQNMLCSDMDGLTDEEKVELDGWKDYMVICGISQQRVGNELSDFDLSPADLDCDSDADA
ncbi:hypothetical protein EV424DRAFT_1348168 [Suillus variegatus]|nr:hypothetical protein EV424DRAFT_1348168 [Suillus variegatus]